MLIKLTMLIKQDMLIKQRYINKIKWNIKIKEIPYVIKDFGSNKCPEKFSHIKQLSECKKAQTELASDFSFNLACEFIS